MISSLSSGSRTAILLVLGSLLLAGCAASGSRQYEIKKRTASECYVAGDTNKCRLSHDLSGGYPLNLQGR